MQFTLSTVLLGALAAMTSATPIAAPASAGNETLAAGPTPQAIGNLYVCLDTNFQGRCQNLQFATGACQFLGNGFDNSISSLGPDQGFSCTIYDNSDCTGQSVGGIVSPGIFDLNDYGFNDRASSYRC